MQVIIYVRDDRRTDGQCSFACGTFDVERAVPVIVPSGSSLVGADDLTCLRTPDSKVYTADEVLAYCKACLTGFRLA